MIIDTTYFIGEINLPTDNSNYTNKLDRYITLSQKKYLKRIFGYELYSLFVAELPTPTSQRFTDILNGAEFTNSYGNLDKWDGLSNTDLESMLAYFTYYEYLKAEQESESGNGTITNLFENSEKVHPRNKQEHAYNLGIEQYNKLYEFLKVNESDYPEWNFTGLEKVNVFNI